MSNHPIYLVTDNFIKLMVLIKPQAKQNQIIGIMNGKLKIAIKATPVDGKANKELIDFLASYLKIKKNSISILVGANATTKVLSLPLSVQNSLDLLI